MARGCIEAWQNYREILACLWPAPSMAPLLPSALGMAWAGSALSWVPLVSPQKPKVMVSHKRGSPHWGQALPRCQGGWVV